MRALVTGATGFIGQRLLRDLERPVVLTRKPDAAKKALGDVEAICWEPESGPPARQAFEGVDTVFHLAGEPVAEGRWTKEKKDRIRDSRVLGTHNLVTALESLKNRPRVLIAASAVGYYGSRGDEILDETSKPGEDYLAEVCQAWEEESLSAGPLGIRVITARIGIVLGKTGGALKKMLAPFRLGLGGRLGTGRHWMSWVHVDDVVGLLLHASASDEISGAMNGVSPAPVTNNEFTRTFATVLHRPAIFPAPEFALRLALGEVTAVLLSSQRVMPRVAEKTGYQFRYPSLEGAIRAALSDVPQK
ncbi:MAG TPA: TIGR01777 family oxidoreductase [Terriglobia bacterium]|nr:TIGR01777 family oxidoreductase [Terriglobia bacterium]